MKNSKEEGDKNSEDVQASGGKNQTDEEIKRMVKDEGDGDSESGGGGRTRKKEKEFTIDEDFFHSVIMPGIYTVIVSGIRQEYVPLFNLIFALEIAVKKSSISPQEKSFFTTRFFKIKNSYDWRLNIHKPSTIPSGFISYQDYQRKLKQSDYIELKMEMLKLYPDMRNFFETLEIRVAKDFSYKEVSNFISKVMFSRDQD